MKGHSFRAAQFDPTFNKYKDLAHSRICMIILHPLNIDRDSQNLRNAQFERTRNRAQRQKKGQDRL